MDIKNLSRLLCRAFGLLLLIFGCTYLVVPFTLGGMPAYGLPVYPLEDDGWTYYTPLPNQIFVAFLRGYLPCILQMLAGVTLLLANRPLGRLLAAGLSNPRT